MLKAMSTAMCRNININDAAISARRFDCKDAALPCDDVEMVGVHVILFNHVDFAQFRRRSNGIRDGRCESYDVGIL